MTTTINATENVIKNPVSGDVIQYLPCSINYTGTTQVEQRFNKFTEEDKESKCLKNSIRGFPLDGKVIDLPEGYTGKCHFYS